MDLSIVIVNWNVRDFLRRCLDSVYAHPCPGRIEVWVVDNASTDGSTQMVRACFPQVKLIENQQNAGFARANNQAIRQAGGRYVLLLNPDTEVKPGALQELVQFMDGHPLAGAAGSLLLNPDHSLQISCYRAPTLGREFLRLFHLDGLIPTGCYHMECWDKDTPREVDILQGACLLLRRQALEQVGLLDESFFIYSEDVDLCYRLQKAGWRLYWVPGARVVHYGGQSTQQVPFEMFVHLYQGKLAYIRKHYGRFAAGIYKFILLGASLPRLSLIPLSWLIEPSKRSRCDLLAKNYWRLIALLPEM